MDIETLQVFSYLTKYGNLSVAAQELHISQSTLSRVVAAMEKETKAQLFDRSKSPMELTPEGDVVLEHICTITSAYYQMMSDIKRLREEKQHVIRISGLFESSLIGIIYTLRDSLKDAETNLPG